MAFTCALAPDLTWATLLTGAASGIDGPASHSSPPWRVAHKENSLSTVNRIWQPREFRSSMDVRRMMTSRSIILGKGAGLRRNLRPLWTNIFPSNSESRLHAGLRALFAALCNTP